MCIFLENLFFVWDLVANNTAVVLVGRPLAAGVH
jgi:hypothetical protein